MKYTKSEIEQLLNNGFNNANDALHDYDIDCTCDIRKNDITDRANCIWDCIMKAKRYLKLKCDAEVNSIITNCQVAVCISNHKDFESELNNHENIGEERTFITGYINTINILVDPHMRWDDTTVCVTDGADAFSFKVLK